jgi:hypothetical protein
VFDRSIYKPAFVASGMWIPIRVTPKDAGAAVDTHANYTRPDVTKLSGAQSAQHSIKYVHQDLPTLAEGDRVDLLDAAGAPISGQAFTVRSPSQVDEGSDDETGYFRRVLLTGTA